MPIGSLGAGRGDVAHRHVVSRRSAEGERAVCARGAARPAATPASAACTRAYEALPDAAAAPHRGLTREARRHLQQRRLRAAGRDADRRSAHLARHAPPARLHASRNADAGCCISAAAATPTSTGCRSPNPKRCSTSCGPTRRDEALGLAHRVAGRRPRALGQPLHDAPPRRLRSDQPPGPPPHADQGRDASGALTSIDQADRLR